MIASDHLMTDRRVMQVTVSLKLKDREVTVVSRMECLESGTTDANGLRVHRFAREAPGSTGLDADYSGGSTVASPDDGHSTSSLFGPSPTWNPT